MSTEIQELIINCDEEAASAVNAEINGLPGGSSRIIQRRNLEGGVASWIVFATLAINVLPQVLNSIARIIELRRVSSIKVGDVQIDNPTAADVRDLKKLIQTSKTNHK